MTVKQRLAAIPIQAKALILSLATFAAMLVCSLVLSQFYALGVADAEAEVTELAPDASRLEPSQPPATATATPEVPTSPATPPPASTSTTTSVTTTTEVSPADPDVSQIQNLWRSGAFVGAGSLALFLILAFAFKVDKKRAFYWSAGLTAISMVVDYTLATGSSPNASMLIGAVTTFVAILARGPTSIPGAPK